MPEKVVYLINIYSIEYIRFQSNLNNCALFGSIILSAHIKQQHCGVRIACQLERKEKGAKYVSIDAATDPGATASMLSLENVEKLQCNVRHTPGVRITTANGAVLDLWGQTDIWIHTFVVTDLTQPFLVCADTVI